MQTELDRIANQNHLQLLKALIPHLPASDQKRFSILIKIMEVQNVIRFYNSPSAAIRNHPFFADGTSDIQAFEASGESPDGAVGGPPPESSASSDPPDLLDVLADVRCYCEGEEQQMIDQALQMMSMIELFSVMAQEDGESGSGDFTSGDRQSDDCAVAHKPDESPPENANYCV